MTALSTVVVLQKESEDFVSRFERVFPDFMAGKPENSEPQPLEVPVPLSVAECLVLCAFMELVPIALNVNDLGVCLWLRYEIQGLWVRRTFGECGVPILDTEIDAVVPDLRLRFDDQLMQKRTLQGVCPIRLIQNHKHPLDGQAANRSYVAQCDEEHLLDGRLAHAQAIRQAVEKFGVGVTKPRRKPDVQPRVLAFLWDYNRSVSGDVLGKFHKPSVKVVGALSFITHDAHLITRGRTFWKGAA